MKLEIMGLKRLTSNNNCNIVLTMMMMIIGVVFNGVAILIVEGSSRNMIISSSNGDLSQQGAAAAGICASEVIIHGYPCQEFHVTTDDGYILSVQRIPDGRRGGAGGISNKQPVLLQHGLLVDGATWMLNSAEESLAYILADYGFDVWIANTRGTRFSRRHISLKPTSREYWNWSWDELVIHDLPAVIDFVSNQTGQKLHYVGHSLGTLVALASFSERRQVDKVKSAALLSPIAYLGHMTTALGVVAAKAFVGEITIAFGLAEFDPTCAAVATLVKVFCSQPGVDCYDLLAALTGKNCCLNASTVEHFLKNEPQPTSTKNLVHLAQRRYFILGVTAKDVIYNQIVEFFSTQR